MTKNCRTLACAMLLTCGASFTPAAAQTAATRGPDASVVRDPALEKDSRHNLEVARLAFKLRKAYVAVINRCEEIIAGNPNFSRMDEALYLAGVSSLRLSQNRGAPKTKLPADQLRDDAREYLSRLVNEFPDSEFRDDADSELRALGGPKPTTSTTNKR
ncbi:MAG: outer membrane protein assembly factor BamD [Pyrinomonadaceae bacterium]